MFIDTEGKWVVSFRLRTSPPCENIQWTRNCVCVCVLQSRSRKSARKYKILSLLLELFFIHAVILYLRKLSTAQIKQRRMIGWLVSNEMEGTWKEAVRVSYEALPLHLPTESTEYHSHDNWCSGWDCEPGTSDYEAEAMNSMQRLWHIWVLI